VGNTKAIDPNSIEVISALPREDLIQYVSMWKRMRRRAVVLAMNGDMTILPRKLAIELAQKELIQRDE
jgi:hypothetical protein